MPNADGLLAKINELISDPNLRDFKPVLEEMIVGIKNPQCDNNQKVIELFTQNLYSRRCTDIATFLYQNQTTPRKKWYEEE